jgi:adenylyltransferase/sulfurtransferase
MKTLPVQAQWRDSGDDLDQYARTVNSILSGDTLAGMRFVVVGAGALGNEVVKDLGLLGAGSVLVVDPDKVELSNLSRSVFFRAGDRGCLKAEVLCRALTSIFPRTRWMFRTCEIADVGFGELADADLFLTCVDNDLARIEVAWIALRLDIPVADAGLGGADYWQGRVSFFAGRSSACFGCKLPPRRRRELLTLALSMGRSCQAQAETGPLSSTPTMAAIVGALQLDFGLRGLAQLKNGDRQDSCSPTLEIRLDCGAELRRFVTPMSPSCLFHAAAVHPSVPLEHSRASARELLDCHNLHAVDLDWPICVVARCLTCGAEWKPMKRVAWLRRRGVCPFCGGVRILENQNISFVDRNSPWVDTPLMDLGLPERHLYALRTHALEGRE